MNKSVKRIACVMLAGLTAMPFVACGKKKSYDPEKTPFVMSTDALDGNFNPFFATSAPDVNVAAHTQIGMLSTNSKGEMICGQNEPTVALDYKVTMYGDENLTQVVTSPTPAEGEVKYTAYEFVIKNGMKFSDGDPLTLEDVLFNLYVYLDPAYTGSSTMYSTKIKGLYNYRRQETGAVTGDIDQSAFYSKADARITDIIYTCDVSNDTNPTGKTEDIYADIAKAQEIFKKDLETDWTDNAGTLESYKEKYNFTEAWEIFYFVEGIVKVSYEMNENGAMVAKEDANGKYITNLDESSGAHLRTDMEAALAGKTGIEREQAMRETAINNVYANHTGENHIDPAILQYWTTGDNVRNEFAAQARDQHFKDMFEAAGNKRIVDHIDGISYYNTKDQAFTGGKMGSTLDKQGHDVLKIVIEKVDPKAIYNFSFTVAPMHYYGNGAGEYANYATSNVKLYPNLSAGEQYHFGVAFNDKTYFDTVLRSPDKNGLPMGAGVYKAGSSDKKSTPTRSNFYTNNVVYFERNTEFDTIGTGLNEANIKYMELKVMSADMIIGSLSRDEIHFGQPNATIENTSTVLGNEKLDQVLCSTNGYGYVGINPKYVSDINVRRIIMRAMDLNYPLSYYGNMATTIYRSMSSSSDYYPKYQDGEPNINGTPVGVYEGGAHDALDKTGSLVPYKVQVMTENGWTQEMLETNKALKDELEIKMIEKITAELAEAEWTGTGVKTHEKHGKLDYVFTIAGDTTDHPAYAMFENAASLLNKCGFKITVQQDITALRKLTEGKLTVWAAAWSSTIDPDMYQVYHKDSTATSIKNWGYDAIYNANNKDLYSYEIELIDNLSDLIEKGRETISVESRFNTYCKALDYVMELAVELPTYQRKDMYVFNANILDKKTMNTTDVDGYAGVLDRLWELNYKK